MDYDNINVLNSRSNILNLKNDVSEINLYLKNYNTELNDNIWKSSCKNVMLNKVSLLTDKFDTFETLLNNALNTTENIQKAQEYKKLILNYEEENNQLKLNNNPSSALKIAENNNIIAEYNKKISDISFKICEDWGNSNE